MCRRTKRPWWDYILDFNKWWKYFYLMVVWNNIFYGSYSKWGGEWWYHPLFVDITAGIYSQHFSFSNQNIPGLESQNIYIKPKSYSTRTFRWVNIKFMVIVALLWINVRFNIDIYLLFFLKYQVLAIMHFLEMCTAFSVLTMMSMAAEHMSVSGKCIFDYIGSRYLHFLTHW